MVKNEIVAKSNKNPTRNVFTRTKKPVSISEKFQIKKLIRTKKERTRNKTTKALRSENREGNNLPNIQQLIFRIQLVKICSDSKEILKPLFLCKYLYCIH